MGTLFYLQAGICSSERASRHISTISCHDMFCISGPPDMTLGFVFYQDVDLLDTSPAFSSNSAHQLYKELYVSVMHVSVQAQAQTHG